MFQAHQAAAAFHAARIPDAKRQIRVLQRRSVCSYSLNASAPSTLSAVSLPATHALGALLESTGKRVVPSTKQQFPSLGSPRVDELHRPDEAFPASRKHVGEFLLSRQHVWNRKIVLPENPPNLLACEQVSGVINGPQ